MTEILIGQTLDPQGPVSVLPETAEEKAKQLPEPATFHILCVLPDINEEYDSGLVKANQTVHYEEVLSPVLFVLVRPNTGTRIKIHGKEFRMINDDSVEGVVQDPRGITRA